MINAHVIKNAITRIKVTTRAIANQSAVKSRIKNDWNEIMIKSNRFNSFKKPRNINGGSCFFSETRLAVRRTCKPNILYHKKIVFARNLNAADARIHKGSFDKSVERN